MLKLTKKTSFSIISRNNGVKIKVGFLSLSLFFCKTEFKNSFMFLFKKKNKNTLDLFSKNYFFRVFPLMTFYFFRIKKSILQIINLLIITSIGSENGHNSMLIGTNLQQEVVNSNPHLIHRFYSKNNNNNNNFNMNIKDLKKKTRNIVSYKMFRFKFGNKKEHY